MAANSTPTQSSPERLAYWYLRLNGFFILENFVIHDDVSSNQRTDADLIGVRFANREENILNPMTDDPSIARCETLVSVVIAEVKTSECSLNGPWTRPADENMQRVLRAVGCFPKSAVELAGNALYKAGMYQDAHCTCRLIAIGARRCQALPIRAVPQILFADMLRFIHQRFHEYERQKASVGNWSKDGQELARSARGTSLDQFLAWANGYYGLR